MSCQCTETNKCAQHSILTFKVDGTFLVPYYNGVPLEPIDLDGVASGGETQTSLQLDSQNANLVYNSEQSVNNLTIPDTIPIQAIAQLIQLQDLQNVEQALATDGNFLVYNGSTSKWQGRAATPGVLVTAFGFDADGVFRQQDVTTLTQAPVDNTPRVLNQTSVSTLTFDTSLYDNWNLTAQATGLTLGSPGVAADHTKIIVRIKDNGTPQSIAYNAIFRAVGVTLPNATVSNHVLYLGARYNAQDGKYDILAVGRE
jgi:hypothetical protein